MISQRDLKLLWGRSGNRCAICHCELADDSSVATESFPLGEHAHIVGRSESSPRGKSILDEGERGGYHNLILLCPNDHARIDKDEQSFPVEKLHMLKANHELWVREKLAEGREHRTADDLIYASLIDAAVELLQLETWREWTSWVLSADPIMAEDAPSRFRKFTFRVLGAVWPSKHSGIKRALQTVALAINALMNEYLKHAERENGRLVPTKFYRHSYRDPEAHSQLVSQYNEWVHRCGELVFECTKAVNWLADEVRSTINPMFFAVEGKFLVEEGPLLDLSFQTVRPEYTEEQRAVLPDELHRRLSTQA